MDYKEWGKVYKSIVKEFGYSEEKDRESAQILNDILEGSNIHSILEKVNGMIRGKDVIVFGAGDSLLIGIKKYRHLIERCTKISADGATSALIANGILPEMIVTDLDGKIEHIIEANKRGSIVVIHAHGDNIEKIKRFVPELKNVLGTTQVDPLPFKNLFNFGGFTDGDRAVFFAKHFDPNKIYLIGFDFDGSVGRYSFTSESRVAIKLRKLEYCRRLLEGVDGLVFL